MKLMELTWHNEFRATVTIILFTNISTCIELGGLWYWLDIKVQIVDYISESLSEIKNSWIIIDFVMIEHVIYNYFLKADRSDLS